MTSDSRINRILSDRIVCQWQNRRFFQKSTKVVPPPIDAPELLFTDISQLMATFGKNKIVAATVTIKQRFKVIYYFTKLTRGTNILTLLNLVCINRRGVEIKFILKDAPDGRQSAASGGPAVGRP